MIIYLVTNKVNGKQYIGQTVKDLGKRKSSHISRALYENDSVYFHRAIRKYGPENFDWEILDQCDDVEFLNKLEIFYIGYYNTFYTGYNLTFGGNNGRGGLRHSVETRKKMSIAKIGEKHPWLGRKHTEALKLKMSKSRMGKKNHFCGKHHSVETKRKISEAQLGEKHHMYGKHLSPETKKKLSLANSGQNSPLFGKVVSCETRKKMSLARVGRYKGQDSPNAVAIIIDDSYFNTRDQAAKFIGVSSATIRKRILHKTKWLNYHYKQVNLI